MVDMSVKNLGILTTPEIGRNKNHSSLIISELLSDDDRNERNRLERPSEGLRIERVAL